MAATFESGATTALSARGRSGSAVERSIPVDRHEALRQVYQWHHDRLIGFFVRRTHDRPLAEDLAQDVIVRFVGALDRFDPTRPVWPYLRTIASNVLIDHLRVDGRQIAVDAEAEFADEPAPGSDLDETVVLRSLLDGAVGDLCERQRVAVELRCERGWSVADAAAFLGVEPGTFNQLLFRARRTLRAALDESGARMRGLAVPLLLDLRMRTRITRDRVREFAQSTSHGVDALASVAVAATIGVTAVVGITNAEAQPYESSRQVLELVRQEGAPTILAGVEQQDPEAAGGGRHTSEPAPAIASDAAADDTASPSTRDATVIEAPDAVPDSGGKVTIADDEEEFVVSHAVEARTGTDTTSVAGDSAAIECDNAVGVVLCSTNSSPRG